MRFVAGRGAVAKRLVRGAAVAERHREDAADREPIKTIIRKNLLAKAHKNADFVLEMLENGGPEGQKRTKTLILCSGRLERDIGNRKSGLPANHRVHLLNINVLYTVN